LASAKTGKLWVAGKEPSRRIHRQRKNKHYWTHLDWQKPCAKADVLLPIFSWNHDNRSHHLTVQFVFNAQAPSVAMLYLVATNGIAFALFLIEGLRLHKKDHTE
jgi:hypothetical protein